jgi:hypothetical protein
MRRAEAVDSGDAWLALLGAPRHGRVVAPFRRAVYLDFDGSVVAVTSGDVPPGPMHLRINPLPPVDTTAAVVLSERALVIGDLAVDLGRVTRWQPPPIEPRALRTIPPETVAQLTGASESALAGHPAVALAARHLLRGDLPAVVTALAGRGVGLTPAGDDVLSGIHLVLAGAGHDREVLALAAGRARTHPIALAFLTWAARGQAVEPVHRLLEALVATDGAAIRRHQRTVEVLGHTSGADLLLGLRLGLGALATWGPAAVVQKGRSASQMALVGMSPGLCHR